MHISYVHHELVGKEELGLHFVRIYLQSYVDNTSKVFMYFVTHMSTFGALHLRGGAWYLDCRPSFTSRREEGMFSSLSRIAPVEADKEDAAQPSPMEKPKIVSGKKAKDGTTTKPAVESTTLVITRLATKATAEAFAGTLVELLTVRPQCPP